MAIIQSDMLSDWKGNAERDREVMTQQIDQSRAAVARSGELSVDLILWPEDVVHPVDDAIPTPSRCDAPVLRADEALGELQRLAAEKDATIVSGWFEPSEDRRFNENYSISGSFYKGVWAEQSSEPDRAFTLGFARHFGQQ